MRNGMEVKCMAHLKRELIKTDVKLHPYLYPFKENASVMEAEGIGWGTAHIQLFREIAHLTYTMLLLLMK